MPTDKNTIGVTTKAQQILDMIAEQNLFPDQMDAAKFAMALAIRRGAKPSDTPGVDTKWNVGSFDKDGRLRDLIPILFPETDTPYRAVESLMNTGLEILAKESGGGFDLLAILNKPSPDDAAGSQHTVASGG